MNLLESVLAGHVERKLGKSIAPLFDLMSRAWIAQLLALASLRGGDSLSTSELYACLSGLPLAGNVLGSSFQVGIIAASVLLLVGLATRPAALILLTALAVSHFNGGASLINIVWSALLGWHVLHGGGAISLDRLLGRGAPTSAAPLSHVTAAVMTRADKLVPVYLAFVRIATALLLILVAGDQRELISEIAAALGVMTQTPANLDIPVPLAGLLWVLGGLLLTGLATRVAALAAGAATLCVLAFGGQAFTAFASMAIPTLLFVRGGGILSLDGVLGREGRRERVSGDWPHVVILGAGFAGLSAAKAFQDRKVRVTIIDRTNHHLFQPLLYQVATAALSPADIARPIRELFRDDPAIQVMLGEVTGIDTRVGFVELGDRVVPYQYLIVATGSQPTYFGRESWASTALSLKTLEDAVTLRNRLLQSFELAEIARTEAERRSLLTFVVVGGGPTGVELAGAIAELSRHGLTGDYRLSDPATARIVLIDRGDCLLKAFRHGASATAARELEALGVEIRLKVGIDAIDSEGVLLSTGEAIASKTVLWAAGVAASQAAQWLGVAADSAGRVVVGPQLTPVGLDDVYVVGDTAAITNPSGGAVPGLAPAAKQAGRFAARAILGRVAGRKRPMRFRYVHIGDLATVGRSAAIADFNWVKLSGALAWWVWGGAHVLFLTGTRNRISVALLWLWSYLTYRRPTRLITTPTSTRRLPGASIPKDT